MSTLVVDYKFWDEWGITGSHEAIVTNEQIRAHALKNKLDMEYVLTQILETPFYGCPAGEPGTCGILYVTDERERGHMHPVGETGPRGIMFPEDYGHTGEVGTFTGCPKGDL